MFHLKKQKIMEIYRQVNYFLFLTFCFLTDSLQIFRIIINYLLLQNASTKWKKTFFSVMSYQFQRFISGKTIREIFKIQIVWGTSLVFLQFELHELSRAFVKHAKLWLFLQKQPPDVFNKKGVLRNFVKFTGKHLCQSLFLNKVEVLCNFIKETLAQVFSRGFCEISKNTFFTEQLWTPASVFNIFTVIFRHYSITNSRMI